jgi:hypothetical protein
VEPTEAAQEFAELMDFIETLPFASKGRMLVIYDDSGKIVPAHRDHLDTEACNEFFWFRTNFKKPFYMLNPDTNEKNTLKVTARGLIRSISTTAATGRKDCRSASAWTENLPRSLEI